MTELIEEFEHTLRRLIRVTLGAYPSYDVDAKENEKVAQILGPYDRVIELQLQDRRKARERAQKDKETSTTPTNP